MRFDNAEFEAAFGTAAQLPESSFLEIAFSGRSNVGKSSLINKLVNRKALARTSSTPGKTVTVNFYRLGDIRLADLPGYGYARVSQSEKARWAKLMERYFESDRNLALVIQLVDMRHPPTKDDIQMLDFLDKKEIPFLIALTKCDKLKKTERARRLAALPEELGFLQAPYRAIPFSSVTGEGAAEIKAEIEKSLERHE